MKKKFSKPFVLSAMVAMLFTTSLTNATSIGKYEAETNKIEQYSDTMMLDPTTTVGILAAGVAGAYAIGRAVGEFIYNISHSGQDQLEMANIISTENADDFSKFDI
ncbi:hypothetical protein [Hymenobacter elongatus]|uniref:DUF4134 domain-containing protein n=1 Tax=Hymenobacter elongatus TaxID=877208 RepID=A0A4Z0PNH2_9BACT|nr:hypothetical protein [Hymenobacter elongatus]TGE18304.1 hypothetical protein E5J99_05205 [Hymenobacter elongatus]